MQNFPIFLKITNNKYLYRLTILWCPKLHINIYLSILEIKRFGDIDLAGNLNNTYLCNRGLTFEQDRFQIKHIFIYFLNAEENKSLNTLENNKNIQSFSISEAAHHGKTQLCVRVHLATKMQHSQVELLIALQGGSECEVVKRSSVVADLNTLFRQ